MLRFKHFLQFIRVLFPTWSFFDQVETVVVIEAKHSNSSEWAPVSEKQERVFGAIFHNVDVNLYHAIENVKREFLRDLKPYLETGTSLGERELNESLAFQQLSNWIRYRLNELEYEGATFQFRLRTEAGEIFFVSHELAVQS